MSWVGRHQTVSARGVAPANGQEAQRDVKVRSNSFNIGLGGCGTSSFGQFGAGVSMDFGSFKVMTRVAFPDEISATEYDKIVNELEIYSSLFLHIMVGNMGNTGIGVILRPYVQLPWFLVDVAPVNDAINSYTSSNDPWQIQTRAVVFGGQILLTIHGARN